MADPREPLSIVEDWPAVASVAVTSADETLAAYGDLDRRRPWASVTKLVTALAILVAVEEGSLSLDDPAGPPGATLRHLLAHASGLPLEGRVPLAAPGLRRIYSNTGIELAAAQLATVTGIAATDYVHAAVLEPLAMTGTALEGSPASGMVGPLRDLTRLARELLAPTLVSPETLTEATTVVFPGLDGVLPGFGRQSPNDWGLGFELRDHKAPHWTGLSNSPATYGHFGLSGSFLWVDPARGLACAELADREFGPWAAQLWPPLADAVVDAYG